MMLLLKQSRLDIVFFLVGVIFAAWDFAVYFTERPYVANVVNCRTYMRYSGNVAGLPGDDVAMAEMLVHYTTTASESHAAIIKFRIGKDFECDKSLLQRNVQLNISTFTPDEGRPVTIAKDWSERLGLSFILIAIGCVIRGVRIGT